MIHPVAFVLGSYPVYWYGILMVLTCLAIEILLLWSAKQHGISLDQALRLTVFLLLGGMIGARLAGLSYGALGNNDSASLLPHGGGVVAYGALADVVGAGWLYTRLKRLDPWALLDLVTLPMALGFAIIRIGCFLNGCCYGTPTSLPWGVVFSPSSLAGIAYGDLPLHPVQLYAFLGNMVLFVALMRLRNTERFEGFLFLAWAALYAVLRFVLEMFRVNPHVVWNLSGAQLLSLFMLPLALGFIWQRRRQRARGNTA